METLKQYLIDDVRSIIYDYVTISKQEINENYKRLVNEYTLEGLHPPIIMYAYNRGFMSSRAIRSFEPVKYSREILYNISKSKWKSNPFEFIGKRGAGISSVVRNDMWGYHMAGAGKIASSIAVSEMIQKHTVRNKPSHLKSPLSIFPARHSFSLPFDPMSGNIKNNKLKNILDQFKSKKAHNRELKKSYLQSIREKQQHKINIRRNKTKPYIRRSLMQM